ncbi:hypothetical protein G3N95_16305 [Paraburkholderia sp. Tr-20389]|uniref:hypothetical protein n=1 Tax=Paraburkholderia sp. Tr-20389 TaxID=2703903 RepID=UPI00198139B0|nr:hypothetical protein [Paraburkholderia sp. Tr-20389]MBN3754513.1 hypothetical protein [Paraburkholderia sp. Tr-20389]
MGCLFWSDGLVDIRGAYINSPSEEVKEFLRSMRRVRVGSQKGPFPVTLPDMENGSMLLRRVETGLRSLAAPARAVSKAKKQLLI